MTLWSWLPTRTQALALLLQGTIKSKGCSLMVVDMCSTMCTETCLRSLQSTCLPFAQLVEVLMVLSGKKDWTLIPFFNLDYSFFFGFKSFGVVKFVFLVVKGQGWLDLRFLWNTYAFLFYVGFGGLWHCVVGFMKFLVLLTNEWIHGQGSMFLLIWCRSWTMIERNFACCKVAKTSACYAQFVLL